MSKVIASMSVSLDGFFVGRNDSAWRPLGDGGDVLHDWIFRGQQTDHPDMSGQRPRSSAQHPTDADVVDELFHGNGAVVMGRRSFDVAEGHWGPNPPFRTPVFVLTHTAHELITRGETSFQFVTDGVQHAIEWAQQAAGGKDVGLHGGSVIQQAIRAKVLDEVQLHLVPVLLGSGRRLFDNRDDQPSRWDIVRVLDSAAVTHVKYRLVG